ncbi:endonuclease [soil metagenome]
MEGPSIYLLAQQLQPFCNQKIIQAFGNAHFEKEAFVNHTIKEIYGRGKRLIIQTEDYALVVHFLMYGTYRIDEQRIGMMPRVALITRSHELYMYNCSAKAFIETDLKSKLTFDFDILSPLWNIKKVVAAAKKRPNATIDDVLLDQEIFAGVGNIIKNETLYLSRIRPTHPIAKLSAKKIVDLACNARLYSQQFLEQRKDFELRKYWTVYHKKECPKGHPIVRKKTGKRDRWSFFCLTCQK